MTPEGGRISRGTNGEFGLMRRRRQATPNTASSSWPAALTFVHPVRDSATAFRFVTRPAVSVVMTASPMLARVVRNRSRCSASALADCPNSSCNDRLREQVFGARPGHPRLVPHRHDDCGDRHIQAHSEDGGVCGGERVARRDEQVERQQAADDEGEDGVPRTPEPRHHPDRPEVCGERIESPERWVKCQPNDRRDCDGGYSDGIANPRRAGIIAQF